MADAGDLRHRVDVYSSTVTPDGLGGGSRTETLLGTVWAQVKPRRGREHHAADAVRGETTHQVCIRYPSFTVTAGCRIAWQGRSFRVNSVVMPDMVTRWLELDCTEGE